LVENVPDVSDESSRFLTKASWFVCSWAYKGFLSGPKQISSSFFSSPHRWLIEMSSTKTNSHHALRRVSEPGEHRVYHDEIFFQNDLADLPSLLQAPIFPLVRESPRPRASRASRPPSTSLDLPRPPSTCMTSRKDYSFHLTNLPDLLQTKTPLPNHHQVRESYHPRPPAPLIDLASCPQLPPHPLSLPTHNSRRKNYS
jgi:hypothetical protein